MATVTDYRLMEDREYETMFLAEDRHWWFQGMTHLTRAVLDKWIGKGNDIEILDGGCGTGMGLGFLREYGNVTGIDFSPNALRFCLRRGLGRIARASILELPFDDRTFDLITSFDVLSSVPAPGDDRGLREFHRVLKPGGRLLLRLPAYEWLGGSAHDRIVGTYNRYRRGPLRRRLGEAGFVPEHTSYANTVLFPLAVAKRMVDRLRREPRSDTSYDMGPMNTLFRAVLKAEAPLVKSVGLPYGLTLVALARRQ